MIDNITEVGGRVEKVGWNSKSASGRNTESIISILNNQGTPRTQNKKKKREKTEPTNAQKSCSSSPLGRPLAVTSGTALPFPTFLLSPYNPPSASSGKLGPSSNDAGALLLL